MRTSYSIIALASGLILWATAALPTEPDEAAFEAALEKAIADLSSGSPDADASLQALIDLLPQDVDGTFIVEGDLALTEEELRDHLLALAPGTGEVFDGELKLNLHNGQPDFYEEGERTLTYAIDRASFPDAAKADEITRLMEAATQDWEAIAPESGLDFVHKAEFDAAPTADLNFIVEFRDAGGMFIARAFFPHETDEDRRVIIDPSFFTSSFSQVGILTHELGHVLGYRHEHIDGIPGCRRESAAFVALTPYDPKSVMHYFCGGGGTLMLSDIDRDGHRQVYGDPQK